ncbi:MAG: hypothetical protein JSR57_07770 [Verrucomicrobia bacterium]|nr:hypothetical protein [Verrucomicrobiota bacterium]
MVPFNKRKGASIAYTLCAGLLMSTAGLHADSPSYSNTPANQEQGYENDLFKKDTPVFFVQAEYLCWLVNEGALDYAVKMKHPAWSDSVPTYAVGHYQNAEFDWASGFRIAFGYFRAPHFWDMFLQYTYLPSFGSNKVRAPHDSDKLLNGTFGEPVINQDTTIGAASFIPLERANSRISLKYHVLDWLSSRRFFPNEHLRLNLFGGVTSAFIYQKWNVYYEDLSNQHAKIRNRWQFEGLGLKLGTKIDWYMGWNIYMTGLASSGILSGWYKNTAHERTQALTAGANQERPVHDTHFHDSRLAYTAQFMGSFSWQKAYESVRAEIGVGYEFNIWANLHQIYRTDLSVASATKQTYINDSLLTLQGFTVRANLDF